MNMFKEILNRMPNLNGGNGNEERENENKDEED